MTDHNRGAYTPQSEAPLAFDARRTGGSGRPPAPIALIASAAILVLIVIALIVFLMRKPDGSNAAAESEKTFDALKTPPEAAAPITEPRPGLQIYTEGQPLPDSAVTLAPPPEQPGLRPTAPVPTPTAKTPVDPLAALTIAPKAAPAPKAPVVAAVPAPAVVPAPKVASVATGAGPMVQIGAFSSAALAEKGWNDVAGMLPGQMAGKTKRVEQVDRDGETLHRAFVGGFASRADADAFCAALTARGRSCLVRN